MVESPLPFRNATFPTKGIGPVAASRPSRRYTDERLKSSSRVCSVEGATVPGADCREAHPRIAREIQNGADRRNRIEDDMRLFGFLSGGSLDCFP